MDDRDDVFIVSKNILKHEAHLACKRDNLIERVAQGVYFRVGADPKVLFQNYGIRLAHLFFSNAVLTHSTAWYKRPVDGRVFVGGDYPYKKNIADSLGEDLRIVQSLIRPGLDVAVKEADEGEALLALQQCVSGEIPADDPRRTEALLTFGLKPDVVVDGALLEKLRPARRARMYEYAYFEDTFGKFKVASATPEMLLIQLMDATKHNIEKHLPEVEMEKLAELLVERHASWPEAVTAVEEIAVESGKENEFERLMKHFFRLRRRSKTLR